MKKIFYLNLFMLLSLLIGGCGQTNNSTSTEEANNNTVTSTENKAVETGSNKSSSSQPKVETFKKTVTVTNNPPKYATKDQLMEALVLKYNNPKAPLSNEQIDQVNDLAKDVKIDSFSDQASFKKIRKRIVKSIKAEILTPEQLLLYPGRAKKK